MLAADPPILAAASCPEFSAEAMTLLGRLGHPAWVFDIDRSRVHWANGAALEVWNARTPQELAARDMAADMSASVAGRLKQYQQDFLAQDARFTESWTLYPNGTPRTLRVTFSGMRLPDGRMAMLCEGLGDLHCDSETLRSAEALLHTTVMITLYDTDGVAVYRNPAARGAVADAAERLQQHFLASEDCHTLMADLRCEGRARALARVATRSGERWHEVSASRCKDAATGGMAWLFSEIDISDLKRTEARANYLALHDTLTGLPNRHYVRQGFQRRLHEVQEQGGQAALIFIDLDRFKKVNDSLGHAVGDQLLVEMASRLRHVLRPGDLVARLGGDEFLVLAAAQDIAPVVRAIGQRLLEAVARPMVVGKTEVRLTPSVGVCLYPSDGEDIDTLMRHADMAMYCAKARGRNGVAFFSKEMDREAQTRLSLECELRAALERREFVVYYQPRLDVACGRIIGAEALVRWQHPQRGIVGPGEFIAVCEDAGLIDALGLQVLEQAARQQLAWAQAGLDMHISINLSPRQFADARLLEGVTQTVEATGCQPSRLEFEITESVLLGNDAATIRALGSLRDLGFGISLDDFGTGYSNLGYLRHYPLNGLKIDRSFINDVAESRAITNMIITLGRMLGLRLVAEGVETEEQLEWLRAQRCDEFQGFLVSPPVPAERFEALARRGWSAARSKGT
jgi:diguanylate cyclase (GGDEF)-like protein